jgi:hypothetical protein
MNVGSFVRTAVLTVTLLISSTSHATLIGDTVEGFFGIPSVAPGLNFWDPILGAPTNPNPVVAVVGAGDEFSRGGGVNGGPKISFADLGEDTITIGLTEVLSLGGTILATWVFDFTSLDPSTGPISNVLLQSSVFFDGIVWNWTENSLHVEIPPQDIAGQASVTFQIESRAVPSPALPMLLLIGFSALLNLNLRPAGRVNKAL